MQNLSPEMYTLFITAQRSEPTLFKYIDSGIKLDKKYNQNLLVILVLIT